MKKVVLCGHTGSNNRGCEAIVRSTLLLLKNNNIVVSLGSFNAAQDIRLGLDKETAILQYQSYKSKTSPARIYNGIMKKLFHNEYPEQKYIQKNIFNEIKKSDAAIAIGGDTYCYNRNACLAPYNMNKFARRCGKKSILWSCSVGKKYITEEMIDDLKAYTMIFPRETVTYNNLLNAGIGPDKMLLMADSAFILPSQTIDMPESFDNVLAYNPSYTIHRAGSNVPENRDTLIKNILKETDLKIALIPHVYDTGFGDAEVCREIYDKYKDSGRLFLFDNIYNCMQLKYIISKCRFLVAERTHASIAGYSSLIPTFVLGYSVKSEGLAKDIFGRTDSYVYPSDKLYESDTYWKQIQYILQNETSIKEHLKEIMPKYINTVNIAGRYLAEKI